MSTNNQNKEIGNLPKENPTAAGKAEPQKCGADRSGQGLAAADILKLLTDAVQAAGGGQGSVRNALPCPSSDKDSPSFGTLSQKLVEAVTAGNSGAAANGDLPFSTLYRLSGKQLSDDLADRNKRPRLVSEILAAQVRDGAITCEILNCSLYAMSHAEIERSLAEGKGKLHNIIAMRQRCEKAVRSAAETLNAVDEALYPKVKIRQRRSVKVRMGKTGKQELTLSGSTMQEQKKTVTT